MVIGNNIKLFILERLVLSKNHASAKMIYFAIRVDGKSILGNLSIRREEYIFKQVKKI